MASEMYGILLCHHEYFFHVIKSGVSFAVCQNPECKKTFRLVGEGEK